MAEKIRLGLIGLGAWGGSLAAAAARCGEAEMVNGFSRTAETRKAFGEKFGCRTSATLDELLNDGEVEGVLVGDGGLLEERHGGLDLLGLLVDQEDGELGEFFQGVAPVLTISARWVRKR